MLRDTLAHSVWTRGRDVADDVGPDEAPADDEARALGANARRVQGPPVPHAWLHTDFGVRRRAAHHEDADREQA